MEEQLAWQGANPKEIPFIELRDHIRTATGDPMVDKYTARIRNRSTAIRAYCVVCQGEDIVGVRECATLTCPLHPYRMNSGDPLRGWAMPAAEEIEIPEEETFEDEDEDDDD